MIIIVMVPIIIIAIIIVTIVIIIAILTIIIIAIIIVTIITIIIAITLIMQILRHGDTLALHGKGEPLQLVGAHQTKTFSRLLLARPFTSWKISLDSKFKGVHSKNEK